MIPILPLLTLSLALTSPVTRGDFAILMWRSLGAVPYDVSALPFADVSPSDPCSQAVCWAYDEALVNGTGQENFSPDRALTREECAALLRRYDARLHRDTFFPESAATCNDGENISPWADDSLYWACSTGRMAWSDNRLAPAGPVSCEEAVSYFPELSD